VLSCNAWNAMVHVEGKSPPIDDDFPHREGVATDVKTENLHGF
jgi:hypothetical protein